MMDEKSLSDLTVQYGLNNYNPESSYLLAKAVNFINLSSKTVFYDLGCGFGDAIFSIAIENKEVSFKGVEIVGSRVELAKVKAKELNLTNCQFFQGDILTFDFSDGDYIFLFNPLFQFQIEQFLEGLHKNCFNRSVVIISESNLCNYLDKIDWLEEQYYLEGEYPNFIKVYSTKFNNLGNKHKRRRGIPK